MYAFPPIGFRCSWIGLKFHKNVQVSNAQEIAQSESSYHSINRDWKNELTIRYLNKEKIS